MIGYKFESLSQFYEVLDFELQEENQWKDVTPMGLELFIGFNLRWILDQTQNGTHAQVIQEKLLKLSNKINKKFTNSRAHNLSFEIMGIALGIFSNKEDKNDIFSQLPSEIRLKIYIELFPSLEIFQDNEGDISLLQNFKNISLVSKREYEIANKTKIEWINNINLSLKFTGCKTIPEAIHYVKNNQNLYVANFSEFKDFTDQDLAKLQNCIWIQHLSISSDKITDEGLKFLSVFSLKSIDLSGCYRLTDKAMEFLKHMPLQCLSFRCCSLLTDNAMEYIKEMPLKCVDFSVCKLLTDNAFKYLNRMQLQEIGFSDCSQITDKAVEYLKDMMLESVDFRYCPQITDKAFEYLKGMPLQRVYFNGCIRLTDKAIESIKKMPLQSIGFNGCNKLIDKALRNLIEYFSSLDMRLEVILF